MKPNQIICGNNIEVVKSWPPNCIDTIITDPPYGLEFMGKDWDKLGGGIEKTSTSAGGFSRRGEEKGDNPFANARVRYGKNVSSAQEWHYHWAKAMLRITKPGGFLLCFGGTRTYHRLACAIEDAGWEIRDCMMWLYGSGFPKSHDISKAIDKTAGIWRGKAGKVSSKNVAMSAPNYERIPKGNPQTELAQLWDGYGTALKPAWEPIIVAMKPLDGTFAHNAEAHGVAGLNIDGGRITKSAGDRTEYGINDIERSKNNNVYGKQSGRIQFDGTQGRWPANLILECICDEVVETDKTVGRESDYDFELGNQNNPARNITNIKSGVHYKDKVMVHTNPDCPCTMLDEQSGKRIAISKAPTTFPSGDILVTQGYSDSGGASRFFYCAKTSRKERNMGMEDCEGKKVNDGRQTPIDNPYQRGETIRRNTHPTVKPLALMKYLCTLLKMPSAEQVILDPFLGSGTTGMACRELGINFVGIEKEPEYCEIAVRRIAAVEGIHPVVLHTETPPAEVPKTNPNDRCYGTTPVTAKMLSDEEHRQSIIDTASAALRRNRK